MIRAELATGWKDLDSIPRSGFCLLQCSDRLWGPTGLLFNVYQGLLLRKQCQRREANHSHLVPRSRTVELYLHSLPSNMSGYGLDDRGVGVPEFSLLHTVQTGSGAPLASYTMGVRRPGCEADLSPQTKKMRIYRRLPHASSGRSA
jgi:hypothetical protein